MEWNPNPIMFQVGPFAVAWYGFFFAMGLLITIWMGHRVFVQRGLEEKHASNLTFATIAGLFIGAHLFDVFFYNWDKFLIDPSIVIDPRRGLSSHGGAAGVILAFFIYSRAMRLDFHRVADGIILAAVWLIPTVRLGNFFNSEVVGRTTEVPWGVVFVNAGLTEPRHPSQLYEALMGVVVISLAYWMHARRDRIRRGATFYLTLGVYFSLRFVLEYFKEYQAIAPGFPLTMGQLLSLPGAAACFTALWIIKPIMVDPEPSDAKSDPEPDAEPDASSEELAASLAEPESRDD